MTSRYFLFIASDRHLLKVSKTNPFVKEFCSFSSSLTFRDLLYSALISVQRRDDTIDSLMVDNKMMRDSKNLLIYSMAISQVSWLIK